MHIDRFLVLDVVAFVVDVIGAVVVVPIAVFATVGILVVVLRGSTSICTRQIYSLKCCPLERKGGGDLLQNDVFGVNPKPAVIWHKTCGESVLWSCVKSITGVQSR